MIGRAPMKTEAQESAEREHRLFWQNEVADAEHEATRALHVAWAKLDLFNSVRAESKSEGVCVKPSQTLVDAAEEMRKVLEVFYYGEAS